MKEWRCPCGDWIANNVACHVHTVSTGDDRFNVIGSTSYMRHGTEPTREPLETVDRSNLGRPVVCHHQRIAPTVRAYESPSPGVPAFMLEVQAQCVDCGTQFRFDGTPSAPYVAGPSVTDSGKRIILPMTPVTEKGKA